MFIGVFMRNLLVLTIALASIGSVAGQELTLFEQIDVPRDAEQPAQAAPIGMGMQPNSQPAFTLRGTSRFGDEYTTTLLNRNGEPVKVKWHEGETVPVPGFDGFTLIGVNSRNVSLVQPAFDSCVASEETGVNCTGGNTAVLSMVVAMPLTSNGTPPGFAQGLSQPAFVNGNGTAAMRPAGVTDAVVQSQQVFVNPFNGQVEAVGQMSPEEQAARAQLQQRRIQRLNQFDAVRAVRIDPADVPPGMRLVRTPFGDRLVPERE
jgi:hypothetical protein